MPLPSEHVSRHHAELSWNGERLCVRDLGSRNGTIVNGRPIIGWVDLADGDVIRFAGIDGVVKAGGHRVQPTAAQDRPRRPDLPVSQVPVFVSHSSQDKASARDIARYLGHRGWTVWIDEAGIAGGKEWHGELIRALESTWVVLIVISIHSMRSRWVIREVQAADRLGLRVVPVVVDDAPYPDELRMILSGVQQVDLTERSDADRRNQQLHRLDEALIHAARAGRRPERGRSLTAVGSFVRAVGMVGIVGGFALFAYLGFTEVNNPSIGDGIPRPFIGWAVFAVFIVVAGIGEAMYRAGLKRGI